MKSKTSVSTVTFRLDINFPNADVDAVLVEAMSSRMTGLVPPFLMDGKQGISLDQNKLVDTPTEGSVDFCLNLLWGFANENTFEITTGRSPSDSPTPLEKLGINVTSIYGLMQGTCHLMCEVSYDKFSPKLVKKAQEIAQEVFDKYCIYYDFTKPACVIQEDADFELRAYDDYGRCLGEDFDDYNQAVMRMWVLGYRPAAKHEEPYFQLPEAA